MLICLIKLCQRRNCCWWGGEYLKEVYFVLLYSFSDILYTHDCTPTHHSNTVVKFADDTNVVELISGGDESAYQAQVEHLTAWCRINNLLLNTSKTKELIVDFRKKKTDIQPLHTSGECVERVTDFRFFGVHISEDLTWGTNMAELVKKAQQRLYFLRIMKRHNIPQQLLVSFYHCSIERHTASLFGLPAAQWHKRKHCRGSLRWPRKSSAALWHQWRNFLAPAASGKPLPSLRTHHNLDTICSNYFHQADDTGSSKLAQTDSKTVSTQ